MGGYKEEWTPEQLMQLRKIYRRGGSFVQAKEYLNSNLSDKYLVKKLSDMGMRFSRMNSMRDGTSVLLKENRNA